MRLISFCKRFPKGLHRYTTIAKGFLAINFMLFSITNIITKNILLGALVRRNQHIGCIYLNRLSVYSRYRIPLAEPAHAVEPYLTLLDATVQQSLFRLKAPTDQPIQLD